MTRLVSAAACATLVVGGLVATASSAAAAVPCGTTKTSGTSTYIATGNSVQVSTPITIKYKNCNEGAVRRKAAINFRSDLACKRVERYETVTWRYTQTHSLHWFEGVKRC